MLKQFITQLDQMLTQQNQLVTQVKSPHKLILALEELDQMVEMTAVKEAVVSQLKYLLVSSLTQDKSQHMLHTVIYGPPGVGKSKVGVILAKIWLSLGLLKQPIGDKKLPRKDRIRELEDLLGKKNIRIQALREKSKRQARHGRLIQNDINRLDSAIARECRKSHQYFYLDRIFLDVDDLVSRLEDEQDEPEETQVLLDDVPFVVASRADFVGKYVGHSAIKTIDFLNAHRGEVVFIDEAYALINGDRDSFGHEALTELNRYMSEHPDEIIIIFAGYKELMQETIFSATIGQPGLERRCTWVFTIDNYTAEGLSEIFLYQLNKSGWNVDEKVDLVKFFTQHYDQFKSFGGDTEKLAFYAKQIHAKQSYISLLNLEKAALTTLNGEMLKEAVKILNQNKALNKEETPPPFGLYL